MVADDRLLSSKFHSSVIAVSHHRVKMSTMKERPDLDRLDSHRRPLRVSMVTETYPPEVNGFARTVGLMADGLRRQGHGVQLLRPRQHRARCLAARPIQFPVGAHAACGGIHHHSQYSLSPASFLTGAVHAAHSGVTDSNGSALSKRCSRGRVPWCDHCVGIVPRLLDFL